jgi:uncharacterized protein with PQ loop repeat
MKHHIKMHFKIIGAIAVIILIILFLNACLKWVSSKNDIEVLVGSVGILTTVHLSCLLFYYFIIKPLTQTKNEKTI